jgi:hypothetical protein
MAVVTKLGLETHVEIIIYDPLPTVVKKRFDNCTRPAIIAAIEREYGDDLIGIAIYDVSKVQVDGIVYRSDPINKTSWTRS